MNTSSNLHTIHCGHTSRADVIFKIGDSSFAVSCTPAPNRPQTNIAASSAKKKRGYSPLKLKHHHESDLILELVTDDKLIAIDRGRNHPGVTQLRVDRTDAGVMSIHDIVNAQITLLVCRLGHISIEVLESDERLKFANADLLGKHVFHGSKISFPRDQTAYIGSCGTNTRTRFTRAAIDRPQTILVIGALHRNHAVSRDFFLEQQIGTPGIVVALRCR